ncbi:MAG: ISAzo13 family transposase [Steroidobacteraceae bacterium]
MIDIDDIRSRWQLALPFLDERGRRLFAANEAIAQGAGGVMAAAQATGLARSTIGRGIGELRSTRNDIDQRVRRPGGGRKSAVAHRPDLPAALEALVESAIRGDPCSALRWVSRSQRHLVKALREQGFGVSQRVVANLLRDLNYSCQANSKVREGGTHPDRDAQFNHINAIVKEAIADGEPAISVDTKKKELVGDFKNNGKELRSKGQPEQVRTHDFKIPALGKVAPYGVYDIAANHGWVSVGIDADTGAFAVESIRRWWDKLGKARYPSATCLTITADCGGSNGSRVKLWKRELQRFANETGLKVTVAHLPPGTSKWNKIEHRLFCHITMNWRGKPLVSHEVIVQLIGSTTTDTGLKVCCEIDGNLYPKGIEVRDEQMDAINITRNEFHGEWNYTISPNQQPP